MSTSKKTRVVLERESEQFGLLANGSSGQWEVAIDGSTSGADRWYAQIEGPSISFYFEIPSLEIVRKMRWFLRPSLRKTAPVNSSERQGSLIIGKDKRAPVTLVKDDEYSDRYFLVVGPIDRAMVRFTIGGMDVSKVAEALRQVEEDLDEDE